MSAANQFNGDLSDVSKVGLGAEWTPPFATGGIGSGIIGVMQLSTFSVTVVIDMANLLKLHHQVGTR